MGRSPCSSGETRLRPYDESKPPPCSTKHTPFSASPFPSPVSYTCFRLEFLPNRLAAVRNSRTVRAPALGPYPPGPTPHVTGIRCTTVQAGGSS